MSNHSTECLILSASPLCQNSLPGDHNIKAMAKKTKKKKKCLMDEHEFETRNLLGLLIMNNNTTRIDPVNHLSEIIGALNAQGLQDDKSRF